MRPLAGITVVTLEHAIAAPFCTRQLADLGARVIKIERPGTGDFARGYDERVRGLASHFVWTNRSKESLTLDVKHPAAKPILATLVARADVLVQNLAPGAAARLGLSYDALAATHPRLIVCDISGYGADGPYRDKKAYDLLIQSESGFLSITGTPDAPAKAGCSIADIAAGMYAYTNILAALIDRERTGRGCAIDVSMLESMVEWMSYPLYYAFDGAEPPPRTGAAHATIYPYGPFPAGDGKVVMLGLQNEREWAVFCRDVLLQPELASRRALRDQLEAKRRARRAPRDHRRGLPAAHRRAGDRPARRRGHRQRADERHARSARASAARGAATLGRRRYACGQGAGARAAGTSARAAAADGSGACARRADERDPARAWLRRRGDRAARRRAGSMTAMRDASPTATLARFASALSFDDIPVSVVRRAEDLLVDWIGSALAGKGARAVEAIERFARQMGPADGPCEVLISRRSTSPLFAALVNAAASHFAEQDDVHNGSVFHPGAVVFPPVLAIAQATGASGRELISAAVAGYEVGIRVGEFLGRSHYKVFHTTGTAGTVAAAAAAGRLLRLDADADAARVRLRRHAGRGTVGIPARRGGLETAAHGEGRGRRPARRVPRARRLHRREADPRRAAGHGRGNVDRRRSGAPRRPARYPLGARRDVVQVARVLPAHASGRGRVALRRHRARSRARRHRARHRARAPSRDRRARSGHRSRDGAPGEVLDGDGARDRRDPSPRRARRVPAAFPRSGDRRAAGPRARWCTTPKSRRPTPSSGSARSTS